MNDPKVDDATALEPQGNSQWEYFNQRRRELFASDPEFRQARLAEGRKAYREGVGGVDLYDCRENLHELKGLPPRYIHELKGEAACVSVPELAKLLRFNTPETLRRMTRDGRVPPPIFTADVTTDNFGREGETSTCAVYTDVEAAAIMKVLGAHYSQVRYYRKSYTETVEKITAAVDEARGSK